MLWQGSQPKSAASSFTGDFRRTLQTHIDAITLRDIDLYALTIGTGGSPCLRIGDGPPIIGRDAVVESVRRWFEDRSWHYHPTILWTFEQERTGIAMLEVSYAPYDRSRLAENTGTQLLVFQRPHDAWRLVLEHRTPAPAHA